MKKLGYRTVSNMVVLEDGEEEVEGAVIRGGGDEVSILSSVAACGLVSVSSLGYF